MLSINFPLFPVIEKQIQQRLIKFARRILLSQGKKLQIGTIEVIEGNKVIRFRGIYQPDRLQVKLYIHNPQFYLKVLLGGTVGGGESYMKGDFSCDDLAQLSHLMVTNKGVMNQLERGFARLRAPYHRILHQLRYNRPQQSRKNIQNHYDLGNKFFKLFLDKSLCYSAAIFPNENSTLAEASHNKMRILCDKLQLKSSDHLLEIGTGWGGLALFAAEHYGCKVTTTTLSRQQYDYVKKLIQKRGLKSKVNLLNQDYRHLKGQYSKIVSVEMIEAIGYQFFETFFKKCEELLNPEGILVLQCIAIQDQDFELAKDEVDFVKKYIFPGSCIPSLESLIRAMTKASSFSLYHLEDITSHYARTLKAWRLNLYQHKSQVFEQGFSEEFFRMWEFYLALCEGAFLGRHMKDVQMIFTKPLSRL